jgi:hypothetical protein
LDEGRIRALTESQGSHEDRVFQNCRFHRRIACEGLGENLGKLIHF